MYKRLLQFFCRRLPSVPTSMSLVVRNRIVVIIGALHGVVIARLIATRLPSCLGNRIVVIIGALHGVVIARLIATRLPSCLCAFITVTRIHWRRQWGVSDPAICSRRNGRKKFLPHYSFVIEDINYDSKYLTSIKWKMTCHWFSGESDYYQIIQIETIQIEWFLDLVNFTK